MNGLLCGLLPDELRAARWSAEEGSSWVFHPHVSWRELRSARRRRFTTASTSSELHEIVRLEARKIRRVLIVFHCNVWRYASSIRASTSLAGALHDAIDPLYPLEDFRRFRAEPLDAVVIESGRSMHCAGPASGANDLALLHAWRAGDVSAGNALLSRHRRALLRFFESKVGGDADELSQRTLLACAESYRQMRGEASFRTYMFAIARHELSRFFKQRARDSRRDGLDFGAVTADDLGASLHDELQLEELKAALRTALGQLTPEDQRLLTLFYGEERDSRQLARLFDLEPSSVRARLHRARRTLERLLERSDGASKRDGASKVESSHSEPT